MLGNATILPVLPPTLCWMWDSSTVESDLSSPELVLLFHVRKTEEGGSHVQASFCRHDWAIDLQSSYLRTLYLCLFTQTCLFPDMSWKSLIGMFLSVLCFLWCYKWDIFCSFCCSVANSYPTLCDAMNCSLPGSSAHGIFQARILEWTAIFLLQEIFPDQGLNHHLLCLVHWQVDSLPLAPPNRYRQISRVNELLYIPTSQACIPLKW